MQSNSIVGNLFSGIAKRVARLVDNPRRKKAGLNWFKEKYLKHAGHGLTRTYTMHGNRIFYRNPSEFLHTLDEVFVNEIYRADLPNDAHIIDCGANIGLSTIYFKSLCPSANIISFEPDDSNYELLVKNIQANNLTGVSMRKEAVWKENTELNFASEGNMGSKIDGGGSGASKKVKATRLKDLLNQKIDFLKIDIEGAEYEVLQDIRNELINVKLLFLEYHGSFSQNKELTEIFNILENSGFHYYIKEAASIYQTPFLARKATPRPTYDIQLNIFCFR